MVSLTKWQYKLAESVFKSKENIEEEIKYFQKKHEKSFERMYGWTWLLKLQEELLSYLETAKNKNLDKIKTKTTLPILKFKLGDTFRFIIHHNERHIVQAKRVLNSLN